MLVAHCMDVDRTAYTDGVMVRVGKLEACIDFRPYAHVSMDVKMYINSYVRTHA